MNKDQNSLVLKIYKHKGAIVKAIIVLIILTAAVTLYISKSAAKKDDGIIISQGKAALASEMNVGEDSQSAAAVGAAVSEGSRINPLSDPSGSQDGPQNGAQDGTQDGTQDGASTQASNQENETIVVDVSGAVQSPMVVIIPVGSRVYEAIEKAGGLTDEADLRNINRAVVLSDGDRLYIPTKKEVESKEELPSYVASDTNIGLSNASGAAKTSGVTRNADTPAQSGNQDAGTGPGPSQNQNQNQNQSSLININTADAQELQKLNGVGPSIADRIITYRNNNGNFKSIDDLKKISGIGAKTFDKFKDKITV